MAAALLVVPAIAAAWLWIAPRGRAKAAGQLLAGGAAMTVVGLAWPMLMWLTPAADRPWVSGTSDNSIWSLILGYNGLGRLFGQSGGPGGRAVGPGGGDAVRRRARHAPAAQPGARRPGRLDARRRRRRRPRPARRDAPAPERSAHRLAAAGRRLVHHHRRRVQPRAGDLPPVLRLAARAVHRRARRRDRRARAAARPARAGGRPAPPCSPASSCEITILRDGTSLSWWPGLLAAGGVLAAVGLALVLAPRMRALVAAGAIALLLLAPGVWAVDTLGHATNGTFPTGGPATTGFGGGPAGGGRPPGAAPAAACSAATPPA